MHPWVPPCRLWVWDPPGHHLMGGRRCGEVPGLWLFPSHDCLTWATLPDFRLGKPVSIQQSRKQKHSDGFGSKFRIGVSNFSSKFHIPQEWIHKLISLPSPQKGSPCAQIDSDFLLTWEGPSYLTACVQAERCNLCPCFRGTSVARRE